MNHLPALRALCCIALVGCASTQVTPSSMRIDHARIPNDIPQRLHQSYWPIVAGEARSEVLYRLNFATDAVTTGAFDVARRQLDLAIAEITSVFSNEKNAQRAMRLWHEEGMKDFKGEPYERAMTFYYRGVLYALAGEYDNARASFEAGYQQDSVAMDSETVADFSSMLYLKAWAARNMGDASLVQRDWRDYGRLVEVSGSPPPAKIAIIETGSAPRKLADGVGHYELVYRRGEGYQPNRLDVVRTKRDAQVLEDVFIQATTRGPRPIDRIIEGKAQFMNRSLAAGTILSDLGDAANVASIWTGVAGARGVGSGAGYASDALNVASAISLLMAVGANPRADTRYWDGLPDRLYVVELPDGGTLQDAAFELNYPDDWRFSLPATKATVAVSESLEWYRVPHRFRYRPPIFYR